MPRLVGVEYRVCIQMFRELGLIVGLTETDEGFQQRQRHTFIPQVEEEKQLEVFLSFLLRRKIKLEE